MRLGHSEDWKPDGEGVEGALGVGGIEGGSPGFGGCRQEGRSKTNTLAEGTRGWTERDLPLGPIVSGWVSLRDGGAPDGTE